ncbi:hypothetical protein [Pelagibius marinus]|uniref:hypothetical protein n=1 Tax=Pelagibius marinus TaxID=2762760 RepID=UPI0018726526|nr:hypothetical protein [Pelagibius marinus]
MNDKDLVSPYLQRPLRSLEEVLRERLVRLARQRGSLPVPEADNSNDPDDALPPAKSA